VLVMEFNCCCIPGSWS